MEDYEYAFQYIIFIIIFIIGFVCLYKSSIELAGFIILYVVQIIASYYLISDVFTNPLILSGDVSFLYVLLPVLGLFFVSMTLITIMISKLHNIYLIRGSEIKLSPENRKKYNEYKTIYITCFCFLVLLCLLFILSGETNFFQIISNNRLWIIPGFLFGLFKIGLSVTTVGLSAYSVYIANELSQIPQQVID